MFFLLQSEGGWAINRYQAIIRMNTVYNFISHNVKSAVNDTTE